MGQAFNKLTGKGGGEKSKEQLIQTIEEVLKNDKYKDLGEKIATNENEFCHAVYDIVESINEKSGAMQLRLPEVHTLREIFHKFHTNEKKDLNKKELQEIIAEVIKLDSFYVGQRAKDVFLYIFTVPIIALFAKRMIPGTSSIPDEYLLPAATSGTVYLLAKSNKL